MKKVKCKKTGIIAYTHDIDVYKHMIGFVVDKESIDKAYDSFSISGALAAFVSHVDKDKTAFPFRINALVIVKKGDYARLCHEATHVAQYLFRWMEEAIESSSEPFAYLTENVFQAGVDSWKLSRK